MTSRNGAWIAESLATRVLLDVPSLADALVRTIQEQNPGYRAMNVVPADDLWRSCHDNLTRVLQLVAACPSENQPDATAPDGAGYYDAARATGQRRAEQRLPLDDVLRSFRLGGRLVWEALIGQAREQDLVDTDGLLGVASRVWEVVDRTSAQVAAAYHATERRLVRADEQRKATLWEGMLQGRAQDLAFGFEASRIVGLPLDGPYLVVVADHGPGADRLAGLVRDRLAGRAIESAWQPRADTVVGLLALGAAGTAPALATLRDVLPGQAGVSLVVSGLAEVGTGYRQATLARRILDAGHDSVVALQERLPDALLLGSPELAEQLVRLWLAPLLALPDADRRLLLDTLETWVATAGSTGRTAETVHCHRNTVINRMRRIQTLTGHDFTADAAPMELSLALRAYRLLSP